MSPPVTFKWALVPLCNVGLDFVGIVLTGCMGGDALNEQVGDGGGISSFLIPLIKKLSILFVQLTLQCVIFLLYHQLL